MVNPMLDWEFKHPIILSYKSEVTKMIIENVKKFADYHAVGKLMSPKGLPFGWDRDAIHKGALKAYKEANILK